MNFGVTASGQRERDLALDQGVDEIGYSSVTTSLGK